MTKKIGTWNVRTLLEEGKMEELATQLKQYNIDIAGIQETRWGGHGKIEKENYLVWYAGEEKQGYGGTAFIVLGEMMHKVMEFKPISERFSYIRVKSKPKKLSIINVYAPTENSDDLIKQQFYETLEGNAEKIPGEDILIIIGDFNAQIGKEKCFREVIKL